MLEWTVRVEPFNEWNGHGEAPVWHFLCKADDAATAEAQTARMTFEGRGVVPEGAIITAYRRFV
jgi:hypothetical protein